MPVEARRGWWVPWNRSCCIGAGNKSRSYERAAIAINYLAISFFALKIMKFLKDKSTNFPENVRKELQRLLLSEAKLCNLHNHWPVTWVQQEELLVLYMHTKNYTWDGIHLGNHKLWVSHLNPIFPTTFNPVPNTSTVPAVKPLPFASAPDFAPASPLLPLLPPPHSWLLLGYQWFGSHPHFLNDTVQTLLLVLIYDHF